MSDDDLDDDFVDDSADDSDELDDAVDSDDSDDALDSDDTDDAEVVEEVVPLSISLGEVDEDGFASIWSIAAASTGGEQDATRALAARLLLFLCKKKCEFVVTSSNNAEYLQNWFERDPKLLYDWKPESEFVDVVSQHAEVPGETLLLFLGNKGFNPEGKYNATRAERVSWFQEAWCVG